MSTSNLMSKVIKAGPDLNHYQFRFLVIMADCPYGPNEYRCETDSTAQHGRFDWRDIEDIRSHFMASLVVQEMGLEITISDVLCVVRLREGNK